MKSKSYIDKLCLRPAGVFFKFFFLLYVRSNYQKCSIKNGLLKNFAKFSRKYLCQSLFLNKVAGLKETLIQVFFWEFCENSINTFFTEHLCATDSGMCL